MSHAWVSEAYQNSAVHDTLPRSLMAQPYSPADSQLTVVFDGTKAFRP